jgi:hypothetical protein
VRVQTAISFAEVSMLRRAMAGMIAAGVLGCLAGGCGD